MSKIDQAVAKMDALCRRADSIVHGGGYERRADATGYPVKIELECSNWDGIGQFLAFLRYVKSTANGGHSFLLAADESADPPGMMFGKQRAGVTCFIDGDGDAGIGRIAVNGKELK